MIGTGMRSALEYESLQKLERSRGTAPGAGIESRTGSAPLEDLRLQHSSGEERQLQKRSLRGNQEELL